MSLLVVNGASVWNPSRAGAEAAAPRAVWIRDGRVVDLTPPAAAPKPGARTDVRVLSLPGRFLIPAFVDAHFHLLSLAHQSLRCDLGRARSAREAVSLLADWGRGCPESEPLVGVDFDESEWSERVLPTREMLNTISTTRPVYARRVCCHVGVGNDALLSRLASERRFVDVPSGRIVEGAVFEANRLTRPPRSRLIPAIDGAIARLHALGVTAIHDIVDVDSLDAYAEGLRESARALRIDAYLHAAAHDFPAARARLAPLEERGVRAAGIKVFADGSLGARTAALEAPYADGDGAGELLVTREALRAELEGCARLGIACAVHAIGDRALRTVLDAMEDATRETASALRLRIEHAEILDGASLERCARLRVPLVVQPNFVRNWGGEGGMYEQRLGRARWGRNNPFATLARAGVDFVFSSDGMPAGPLFGIKGATHHPVEGERIAPAQAFYRYTGAAADVFAPWAPPAGGAAAAGRIEPGARADLVVLSAHPLLADTDALRVDRTFAGGVEVYRAAGAPRPDEVL
jgi:hypothetical protein